jgi:hypothetical protein
MRPGHLFFSFIVPTRDRTCVVHKLLVCLHAKYGFDPIQTLQLLTIGHHSTRSERGGVPARGGC